MKVSVLIPTWRRVEFLDRALRSLESQNRPIEEAVVGCRDDDQETLGWLVARESTFRVVVAQTSRPGTVASMQAALERTSGDIVCLLDDDAAAKPDWIERLVASFEEEPSLGAIGGRDLLAYLSEEERGRDLRQRVGVTTWYGKPIGNHHCGAGGRRPVEVVKGCNCAFRGDLLRRTGFETRLRGVGTQHEWEMALCHDVRTAGFGVAYDPSIQVTHHVAPRFVSDQNHRGGFSAEGIEELSYNEAFVVASRLRGWKRFARTAHATLVGSHIVPGALQLLRLRFIRREAVAMERWRAARRGWCGGSAAGDAAQRRLENEK